MSLAWQQHGHQHSQSHSNAGFSGGNPGFDLQLFGIATSF
jgi:hypothetical protein